MRMTVRKMPLVWPDRVKVPFKSMAKFTANEVDQYLKISLYMNSLKDPWAGNFNFYADGFNRWSTIYAKYLVYYSKIKVEIISTGGEPGNIVVYPGRVSGTASTANEAMRQRYARDCHLNEAQANIKNQVIYNKMSVSKLSGEKLYSVNYSANYNGDPSYLRYWHIFGETQDTLYDEVTLRVTLWQYAILYAANTVPQVSNT